MTLISAILKKVKSQDSVSKKYPSPPPEINVNYLRKKKNVARYEQVRAVVDAFPPKYDANRFWRPIPKWQKRALDIRVENMRLLFAIRRTHFMGGKVDCHWSALLPSSQQYRHTRVTALRRIHDENKRIYRIIKNAVPRVIPAASLEKEWRRNKREIVKRARSAFVLFPPTPRELIEDATFAPPPGVKRPRVYLTLRIRGGACLGELAVELFTDACPLTCRLFLELADGDGVGFGYVGTHFFRKVPGLYWSGGDVARDNGFGCYAPRGRNTPIAVENYHFAHSMPGLVSMRVTSADEVCGIFNITFKPLPQFDLHNVVFGRIIRPCNTYESLTSLGRALSTRPAVQIASTRRRHGAQWRRGLLNTTLLGKRNLRTHQARI